MVYTQTFRSGWLPRGEGKENNCRSLEAERPAAAMFVYWSVYVSSTRTFRVKVVYMVPGSFYLSTRKIQLLERSLALAQVQPFACKLNTENMALGRSAF